MGRYSVKSRSCKRTKYLTLLLTICRCRGDVYFASAFEVFLFPLQISSKRLKKWTQHFIIMLCWSIKIHKLCVVVWITFKPLMCISNFMCATGRGLFCTLKTFKPLIWYVHTISCEKKNVFFWSMKLFFFFCPFQNKREVLFFVKKENGPYIIHLCLSWAAHTET